MNKIKRAYVKRGIELTELIYTIIKRTYIKK